MKEAPDNLVSKAKVRLTDLLCEGPIQGFVSGNDNYGPLKSTFFNETVMMNANNTFNLNLSGDFNYSYTLGNSGQAVMNGFGNVENFLPLPTNTEIKQLVEIPANDNDYKDLVVTLNNRTYPDAGTARITLRVPSLLKQIDPTSSSPEGSLEGYEVKFIIEVALNGGTYVQQGNEQIIFGKTTSGYSKSIEIPLPSDGSNYLSWKIRIRRTTQNISSIKVANSLFVQSVSVISSNTYNYPNTALVGLELDSEKLGGDLPARAYEIYGLKIRVPDNYNAVTRGYTGIWLGGFKADIAQGSNIVNNPNFNTGTTGWTAFRSVLSTSAVSPPGGFTNYGVVTVNVASPADGSIQKTYFSAYQTPAAPQSTTYIIKGYYKVSNAALNFKVGINNIAIDQYTTIGNSTAWVAFETQITSAGYSDAGNWVEFAAQRAGECLTTDVLSFTGIQVFTPAADGRTYTNNPAWVFYDLCTNERYGLGNYMKSEWIDKWTLYQIGQYCDTMVDDGNGGQEPRFTCNVVIDTQQDAYQVLLQMVSIFRGMLYFASGRLFPIQDALKTFVYQFTNANTIDGIFNYGSSSRRTRHTVAVVKWIDPQNLYKETVEYVEDTDGITKYGYQQLDMTAFGCTSQGQAYRAGKWALVSEALETETVSFRTALEGSYLRPGDIFQVYDNQRYNLSQGGRVATVYNDQAILLDRDVKIAAGSVYNITVITPRFYLEGDGEITGSDQIGAIRNSQVTTARVATTSYTGNAITTTTSLGSFGQGAIWNLTQISGNNSSTVAPKQYRCLATSEYGQYDVEVLGLEYQSGKYALIETGFTVVNNQVYNDTPTAPPVPGGLSDGTNQRLDVQYVLGVQQDFVRDYLTLDWFPVESDILKFYRIRVTPPGGSPSVVTDTLSDTYSYALSGCRPAGNYLFSVTSVGKGLSESAALTGGYVITSSNGVASLTFNTPTPITGMYGWPYDANNLPSGFESRSPTLNVLRNTGDYDGNDPRFFYITGYNFKLLDTGTSATILDLGDVTQEYAQLSSANIATIQNRRTFDVRVTPLPCLGLGVNGFAAFTQRFTNIPPLPAASTNYTNTVGGFNYNIGKNIKDTDISGVYLWSSLTSAAFTPSFGNQTLSAPDTAGFLPLAVTGIYNLWYSLIDSYGTGGCIINGPTVSTYSAAVDAGDIADGSLTYAKFPSSVQPIQVLSSLPVSGTFVGQVVFLTTDSKLYRWNGATWTTVVDNSDIANNAITTNKILDGAISTLKIADSGITAAKMSNNSVTASSIAAGSIIAGKIAANAIVAGDIAALAVTAGTISARSISGDNIVVGSLRGDGIAANTITGNNLVIGTIAGGYIAADAISGTHIRAGQIDATKMNVSQLSAITADIGNITAGTIKVGTTFSQVNLADSLLRQGSFSVAPINIAGQVRTTLNISGAAGSLISMGAIGFGSDIATAITVGPPGSVGGGATPASVLGPTLSSFNSGITVGDASIINASTTSHFNTDVFIGNSSFSKWLYLDNDDNQIRFGHSNDVNLYRGAVNRLQTDDDFYALSLTSTSSRRFKTNIRQLENGLISINALQGVIFDWNGVKDKTSKNDIGLIAEDVAKVLPSLVMFDESGNAEGLDYSRLTAVLIEAVKELTTQVKDLRKEIDILKNKEVNILKKKAFPQPLFPS